MTNPPSPAATPLETAGQKLYHVGTLTYTKPALVILFFWLLWGDFCYTLMEGVTGPIMLLKFQALNASNFQVGLILGTIPGLVYSVLNPIISFKSDRFRSRWGRRIPFIFTTLPFVVLGLVALAFSDKIGFWLQERIRIGGFSGNGVVLWTIGLILVAFTFFNTFVTSVFWYLFNDVVPEHLLARFMSWFRTIGMASTALYQLYIFPHSGTHSTQIFLGAAMLYLVGFGLMCFNVREGQYPPPPAYVGGKRGPLAAITTYGRECHSHAHYWYLWSLTFIGAIGGGTAMFGLYYQQTIGLDLTQISRINFTNSVVVSVLILGSGWLADRYHPIRVVLVAAIVSLLVVTPSGLIWLFWYPAPKAELFVSGTAWLLGPQYCWYPNSTFTFWVVLAMTIGLSAPVIALNGVWDPPMLMRLFPRERYGQFCSTNAVWRAVGGLFGGSLAGGYLDIVGHMIGSKARAYFYMPFWNLAFSIPTLFLLIKLYGSWKRHGGDDAYVAPALKEVTVNPPMPSPLPETLA